MSSIFFSFYLERGDFCLDVQAECPVTGITGIVGHSGAGKTSLLRCIAGLEKPERGELIVAGEVWQNGKTFLKPHRRSIGYIFQESCLFQHLTVAGNIAYGYNRIAPTSRKVTLEQLVQMLDISHLLSRHPEHLSGGERQRVAMARALAVSPKILLMDEPLASLDMPSKQEIIHYLKTIQSELQVPILYVSHCSDEIEELPHHLLELEKGRLRLHRES